MRRLAHSHVIWVLAFRGMAAVGLYLAVRDESVAGSEYQFLAFVVSFSSISQGLDFGLGNAVAQLTTRLPKHEQSLLLVRRIVSRTSAAFGGLSGAIVVVFVVVLPSAAVGLGGAELITTAFALGISTGLNVRAAGLERSLIGLGYHRMAMIAAAAVAAAGAIGILAVVWNASIFPWACVALLAAALLKLLVLSFCADHVSGSATPDPDYPPASYDLSYRSLLRNSGIFFCLQLIVFVAFQSDTLVAGAIGGPEVTRSYATSLRFFAIIPGVVGILSLPLWRSFATSIVSGDRAAAWRQFVRAERLILAGAMASASVVATILILWPEALLGSTFPIWFGVVWIGWVAVFSWGQIIAHIMASLDELRYQVILSAAMMVVNIALSIWATKVVGAIGPALGTVVSYFLVLAVPSRIRARRRCGVMPSPGAIAR